MRESVISRHKKTHKVVESLESNVKKNFQTFLNMLAYISFPAHKRQPVAAPVEIMSESQKDKTLNPQNWPPANGKTHVCKFILFMND